MEFYTLYTYCGASQLRRIQSDRNVFPFQFGKTKTMLEDNTDVIIDITALVYYLKVNTCDIYAAQVNLLEIDSDTQIIVEVSLAEAALELFPFIFFENKNYYEMDSKEDATPVVANPICQCIRRTIYKYGSTKDLDEIICYANSKGIPIATFSQANGDLRKEFDQFNKFKEQALIDLTSITYIIEDNKSLIYALEQLILIYPNVDFIVEACQVDKLFKYFSLFFEKQEPIEELIPELSNIGEQTVIENHISKITELSADIRVEFIKNFNHNLIGHKYFKEQLQYAIKNFITLNSVSEQKVLSIFLFGGSGIGKTEVARLLANGLQEDSYFAKINFQNYSSQDALNSLIGSPAGYIGCNHGELSEKVSKSKVAVLLCDEFEKTTHPVFSFFLELLEEGQFTDSMAREYNMDGWIIVFTSNISNEAEYKKYIPPELQTRFDLVCEFEEPTLKEKTEFLDLLLEKAKTKYAEKFVSIEMNENDKRELYAFDYSSLSALRDIKRAFNYRLMDLFEKKGV